MQGHSLRSIGIFKYLGLFLAAAICILNFTPEMQNVRSLPTAFFAESDEELDAILSHFSDGYSCRMAVSNTQNENLSDKYISVRLFGIFELKTIPVYVGERRSVHPCGDAIGISMRTKGLLVVGNGTFLNSEGKKCSPSADAGLHPGDVILSVNDAEVNTSDELQSAIEASSNTVKIVIERD